MLADRLERERSHDYSVRVFFSARAQRERERDEFWRIYTRVVDNDLLHLTRYALFYSNSILSIQCARSDDAKVTSFILPLRHQQEE